MAKKPAEVVLLCSSDYVRPSFGYRVSIHSRPFQYALNRMGFQGHGWGSVQFIPGEFPLLGN